MQYILCIIDIKYIIRFLSFFVLTRIITVLYSLDPFHKPVCNSCILVKPKIESLQIFMCLNEETSETFYPKPTFYLEYLNVLSLKARNIISPDSNIKKLSTRLHLLLLIILPWSWELAYHKAEQSRRIRECLRIISTLLLTSLSLKSPKSWVQETKFL